jgi:hypothetical protein
MKFKVMNNKFKELADKANAYTDVSGRWANAAGMEKFAELIVQECMTTILKESKWYWDKDEFESSNAIQNAARRVKEHFGVEE